VEMLEAMFGAFSPENEKLVIEDSKDPGIKSVIRLEIGLHRVRVTLEYKVSNSFPDQKLLPVVVSSRGLLDSHEAFLVKELIARDQEDFLAHERHSVVGLFLHAQELIESINDHGGSCAVCLCSIGEADDFYKAECWHLFHSTCLSAWWNQVDQTRTGVGSKFDGDDTIRKQQISSVTSRIDELEKKITFLHERISLLELESSKWDNALQNTPTEKFYEEFFSEIDETMTDNQQHLIMHKQVERISCELKILTSEIRSIESKLEKLRLEKEKTVEAFNCERDTEIKQGIVCPVCRTVISRSSEIDSLLDKFPSLVPKDWSSSSSLTEEQLSWINQARDQQRVLFNKHHKEEN